MPKLHRAKEGDLIPISDYNLKAAYLEALINMKVSGDATFTIDRGGASLHVGSNYKQAPRWVSLQSALEPAGNPQGPATGERRATGVLLSTNYQAGGDINQSDIADVIDIVNRDPNFSANAGDVILVARVSVGTALEWQPVAGSRKQDSGSGSGGGAGGLGGCGSRDCARGVTLPDGTVCCTGPVLWTFTDPWRGFLTTRELQYAGNDEWSTEEFEGPECDCPSGTCSNTYRWTLTPSLAIGASTLSLEIVQDNGCDVACIKYIKLLPFQCKCTNEFDLSGEWENARQEGTVLGPKVCLTPYTPPLVPVPGEQGPITICGVVYVESSLPSGWLLTGGGFDGGWCGGGTEVGNGSASVLARYSGSILTQNGSTEDIWADINNVFNVPLVVVPGASFESVNTYGYRWYSAGSVLQESPNSVAGNILVGHTCNPIGSPCVDVLSRAALHISCEASSNGDPEFLNLRYILEVPQVRVFPPNFFPFIPYHFGYTTLVENIDRNDVACQISSTRSLALAGAYVNLPDGGNCDHYLDPPLDDIQLPSTITITPVGGPTECEGPPAAGPLIPNSSGACASCTTDSSDPDNDDGSCCVDGNCLQFVSSALCASFGGTLYDNQALCEDDCRVTACCVRTGSDAACTDNLTQAECFDLGGNFSNSLSCSEVSCNPTTNLSAVDVYDVSDTWTAPAGVTSVFVQCWGAGGGGARNGPGPDGGGGGGGGAYADVTSYAVTPGVTYLVSVGSGGAGGSDTGADGGDTYFDNTSAVFAPGGDGASGRNGGAGGNAASAIGDITNSGGDGGDTNDEGGGGGGASGSRDGNGGNGTENFGVTVVAGGVSPGSDGGDGGDGQTPSVDGESGSAPGGAGGGGGGSSTQGGDGANGRVKVWYSVGGE